MPTDTIYGIVGCALRQETVERIYKIKNRNEDSPFIILVGSMEELEKLALELALELTNDEKNVISKFEKPTSFILPVREKKEKYKYLYQGQDSLTFRIPIENGLCELLRQAGPLVAPSANPKGLTPAKNIKEAQKYFGDEVDLYIDDGEMVSEPSRIVRLYPDGKVSIIRE